MATKKIIEVDVVNSLLDSDTIFVNSSNSLKQISKSNLVMKGIDGGYYAPAVDADGNLSWTASKADMPAVDGANIKGPKGVSGVYVGSGDMPDGYNVQIDPDGIPSDIILYIGANGNWYIGDTDTGKPSRGEPGPAGADGKSAYQYAQEGGYTGTEAEFAAKLAQEKYANPNALTFTGAVTGSYDGSTAKTVNIPSAVTDAHINSLIDTKLGVIENGSY